MNIRYRVTLTVDERAQLATLVRGGKAPVRRIKRAQILLGADGGMTDEAIAGSVSRRDRTGGGGTLDRPRPENQTITGVFRYLR